jgi:hypothetical protein
VPFRPVDDRAVSRAFEHEMSRYDRGAGTDVKVVLSAAMGVLRDHGSRLDPQLAPLDRTFTEAALDAVTELAEETFAGEYLAEIAKKQGIRLASRAIQETPDYLKGLQSWRDQVKKGRLTLYLDTSAVSPQVDQLQGHRGLGDCRRPVVTVGVLVGAVIASAIELVFQQHAPHIFVKTAQVAFAAGLGHKRRSGFALT